VPAPSFEFCFFLAVCLTCSCAWPTQVPRNKLEPGKVVQDQTTGCLGCSTGAAGYENIFGNKYGQNLADIQIEREHRLRRKKKKQAAAAAARAAAASAGKAEEEEDEGNEADGDDDGSDDSSSDSDDEATPWLSAAALKKREAKRVKEQVTGGVASNERPAKRKRGQ